MTDKTIPFKRKEEVTLKLTYQQLTDVRVAVLQRLTLIKRTLEKHPDDVHTENLQHSYLRLYDIMSENGVLTNAMRVVMRQRSNFKE